MCSEAIKLLYIDSIYVIIGAYISVILLESPLKNCGGSGNPGQNILLSHNQSQNYLNYFSQIV